MVSIQASDNGLKAILLQTKQAKCKGFIFQYILILCISIDGSAQQEF